MTKEKIIETIAHELIEAIGRDTVDRFEEDENGVKIYLISLKCVAEKIANKLLELIEQEKEEILKNTKATIKLILLGFQCALDEKQPERAVEETILRIAERYGVEL